MSVAVRRMYSVPTGKANSATHWRCAQPGLLIFPYIGSSLSAKYLGHERSEHVLTQAARASILEEVEGQAPCPHRREWSHLHPRNGGDGGVLGGAGGSEGAPQAPRQAKFKDGTGEAAQDGKAAGAGSGWQDRAVPPPHPGRSRESRWSRGYWHEQAS